MEGNQIVISVDMYNKLSDRLSGTYSDFNSFLTKSKWIKDECVYLEQELQKLPALSVAYPNFENEINQLIGSKADVNSPKNILDTVSIYYSKMVQIDRESQGIKNAYQKLIQLPDRFGKADLSNKLSVFLNNIQSISINVLDKMIDEVIPNIKKSLEQINVAFANEDATISSIKQSALDLISRLESHKNSQDRYGLKTICSKGIVTLNNIISNPNYNNLASDANAVQQIKDKFEQCEAYFLQEKNLYEELLNDYSSNFGYSRLMWAEDVDNLRTVLKGAIADIFNFCHTTDEVQKLIDTGVEKKRLDLQDFHQLVTPQIHRRFKSEIEEIEQTYAYRTELDALKITIEDYIKEENRKRTLNIFKWIGIVIGSVLLLWLIINYWIWFAVIGGILIVVYLIILFKS